MYHSFDQLNLIIDVVCCCILLLLLFLIVVCQCLNWLYIIVVSGGDFIWVMLAHHLIHLSAHKLAVAGPQQWQLAPCSLSPSFPPEAIRLLLSWFSYYLAVWPKDPIDLAWNCNLRPSLLYLTITLEIPSPYQTHPLLHPLVLLVYNLCQPPPPVAPSQL